MSIDLVTVVNDDTVKHLHVQARSIAKFLSSESVGTINIIVNSFNPEESYKYLIGEIADLYGRFRSRVEIYPVSRFSRPHFNCSASVVGDSAALVISRLLDSTFYLLMQPGDHFIRPSRASDFGDSSSNRSRAARVEARASTVKKAAASFDLLGAPLPEIGVEFIADQLPFAFNVGEMRALVGQLESQYNAPLDDILAKVNGAIHPVYLYVAFMMRETSDIRNVFKVGPRIVSGLRSADGGNSIDAWVADAQKRMLANVDSLRESAADEEVERKLAEFWVGQGLFDDLPAASIALPRPVGAGLGAVGGV